MNIKDRLLVYFGKGLRGFFSKCEAKIIDEVEEIRLRANKPIIFKLREKEYYLWENGLTQDMDKARNAIRDDLLQMLELMSDYSVYSFEEEIKKGFITLKGGFRVGITGRCVCENKKIISVKYINSINIRICREIKGCADKVIEIMREGDFKNILIISPPNCGKTTFLRDIIRQLSDKGNDVGVVDERSEIGGCYLGEIMNDVGVRTDILDRCPKTEGIFMLIRSMAPKYVAADEITAEETEALAEAAVSGIGLICTAHGESIEDIINKKSLDEIRCKGIFELFILLEGQGKIKGIYDRNLREVEYAY